MTASSSPNRARGARAFIADTAFVFAAQVLTKLRGLLTMPLLIKGLGTDAFGTWSQTLAFVFLMTATVALNLHHSLIRSIAADRDRAGAAYATTLFASLASSSFLAIVVGLCATPAMSDAMVGTDDRRILWLSLVLVVTATVRNLNLNLYRATDRIKLRSVIDFIGSLVELTSIIVVLLLGYGLVEVLAVLAALGVCISGATTYHAHTIAPLQRIDRDLLRAALRYGVPLVPAGIAMWALDRSDRFVISHFWDQKRVGIYSAHYAIASLIIFVQGPIQMALTPKVMQLWDGDRPSAAKYVEYSFRIYATFALLFVVLAPILAPNLFRILANEEVAASSSLSVLLIALGTSFWGLAVIESCGLFAARRTRTVGGLTAACAITNVAVCLALVPRFGTIGAAAATAIAYASIWIAYARSANKVWTISRSGWLTLRAAIATVPVGGLGYLVRPSSLLGIMGFGAVALTLYGAILVAVGAITTAERKTIWDHIQRRLSGAPKTPAAAPPTHEA